MRNPYLFFCLGSVRAQFCQESCMSALSPRRRSVLRAVVTSAALTSAVLAPAAAAFADAPAVPGAPASPSAPAATAVEAGTATTPAAPAPADKGQKSDQATAEPSKKPEGGAKSGGDKKGEPGTGQLVAEGGSLPGGAHSKVYRIGAHHHRAEIITNGSDGKVVATIDADGKPGVVAFKDIYIELNPANGAISWDWKKDRDGQEPGGDEARCTVTKKANIGAGTMAVLINGPKGPQVRYEDGDGGHSGIIMDREHPSDGRTGHIIDPDGAHPQLWTKMQGGGYPSVTTDFPELPEGCTTNTPAQPASSGAAAQTKAVPEGGVAAGAEGVREGNDTALAAAVGGFAAVSAAGIAFTVLRRRAAGVRG